VPELVAAARYVDQFYRGNFLGQPILERVAQFMAESIRFRELMADLFAGVQSYVTLNGRCYRILLPVLWNAVTS
jgi:hypothetical protein